MKTKNNLLLILNLIVIVLLISCEDNQTVDFSEQNSSPISEEILKQQKLETYKKIGLKLLQTANENQSFKEIVYKECLKQKYGDYFIKMTDVLDLNENHYFWNDAEMALIESDLVNLRRMTDYDPVIFVPSVEYFDNPTVDFREAFVIKNLSDESTKVVFKDEYDSTDHTCPGYSLIDDDLLFEGDVDEDYAWENDIWVIGDSEFGPDEFIAEDPSFGGGSPPTNPPFPRTEGRAEYGGIIQVTDLNEVEHWISGKLEFRIIIVNSTGTVIKDESFPKRKRSRFTNNKWYDYDTFIANWNTSNIGNYMIEGWIERDGGGSTTVSQSFPAPPGCDACPSTTITYNLGSNDEDLGKSIVQFSDNVGQVYGISFSNFKRK